MHLKTEPSVFIAGSGGARKDSEELRSSGNVVGADGFCSGSLPFGHGADVSIVAVGLQRYTVPIPRHGARGWVGRNQLEEVVMVDRVAVGSTCQAKAVVTSANPKTRPRAGSLKGTRSVVSMFPATVYWVPAPVILLRRSANGPQPIRCRLH